MKKHFLLFLAFFVVAKICNAQIMSNANEAFSLAKEKNKTVLLLFSGSDWCAPCMRFEKKVLQDSAFMRFSTSNLVLLEADFPQSKKLAPETVKQNEALADRYNPTGSFPLIVLLSADQKVISYLSYSNETANDFIRLVSQHLL